MIKIVTLYQNKLILIDQTVQTNEIVCQANSANCLVLTFTRI